MSKNDDLEKIEASVAAVCDSPHLGRKDLNRLLTGLSPAAYRAWIVDRVLGKESSTTKVEPDAAPTAA